MRAARAGYVVGGPGRARALPLRGRLRSLSAGRQGRIRHDRVAGRGCPTATGRSGIDRALLPGRGAVAGGRRVAAAAQGDGAGDDVLDRPRLRATSAARSTCRGCRGSTRRSRPTCGAGWVSPARGPTDEARSRVEAHGEAWLRHRPLGTHPALAGRRAGLLRVARSPGRRALLGLPADREPLRPGADPGAQPLGWHDEGYGPGGAARNFLGTRTVGRPARDRAVDPRHADAAARRAWASSISAAPRASTTRPAAALLRPLAEGDPERHRPRAAGADLRDGRQRLARRGGMAARARAAHGLLPARRRPAHAPSRPQRPSRRTATSYDPARSRRRPARREARSLRPEPARGAARRALLQAASRWRATSR